MTRFFDALDGVVGNPNIVRNTPILTTLLLEGANVWQMWQMWRERSALGQSLWGWSFVWLALVLWANYYRVMVPDERRAFWATVVGIGMNSAVILTVVYFRYVR